jgi:hypothetical protein
MGARTWPAPIAKKLLDWSTSQTTPLACRGNTGHGVLDGEESPTNHLTVGHGWRELLVSRPRIPSTIKLLPELSKSSSE